jgi:hypothetical protein
MNFVRDISDNDKGKDVKPTQPIINIICLISLSMVLRMQHLLVQCDQPDYH